MTRLQPSPDHSPADDDSDGQAARPAAAYPASEIGSARDNRLRQAAHELFAEHGLGVPLADLAKAAGMGVATLYRRYKDKDILIVDVYREHMAAGEHFAKTANSYADPWEGIEYFLRRSTDQLLHDRGMRELVLGGYIGGLGWARGSTHQELTAAVEAMEGAVTAELKILVASAKAVKAVRADFEHQDLLLISAMAQAALPVDRRGVQTVGLRALELLIEGIRPVPAPGDDTAGIKEED